MTGPPPKFDEIFGTKIVFDELLTEVSVSFAKLAKEAITTENAFMKIGDVLHGTFKNKGEVTIHVSPAAVYLDTGATGAYPVIREHDDRIAHEDAEPVFKKTRKIVLGD